MKRFNAYARSINPCHPGQMAQTGQTFCCLLIFCIPPRTFLSHDSIGCQTKQTKVVVRPNRFSGSIIM